MKHLYVIYGYVNNRWQQICHDSSKRGAFYKLQSYLSKGWNINHYELRKEVL